MSGYTDKELQTIVRQLEGTKISINNVPLIAGVRHAFKTKPFIYGTQGKGGGGLKLGGIMAASINNKVTFKNGKPAFEDGSKGYAFQTGARQTAQREHNYQMMDMYYGDGGNVGLRANPFIMEFVLYATKLKPLPAPGTQEAVSDTPSHANHPFALFKAKGVDQAWAKNAVTAADYGNDAFRGQEMTGTKELSRIIRWCVGEFGGTIVFEGVDVYYDQVFNSGRFGDTELEAADLFQYFRPGQSEAKYGRGDGKIIFHWQGQQTVPSKLLFLTSWKYDAFAAAQWYKLIHPENFETSMKAMFSNAAQVKPNGTPNQWGGQSFDASHTARGFGSAVYGKNVAVVAGTPKAPKKLDAKAIDEFANKINITHKNLWDRFCNLPPNIAPWAVGEWLERMK